MADISQETAKRILDLPMQPNDADASTVREYLIALVREVVRYGEGFSGKRPFGNSGWESDLHVPLIRAGLLPGRVDEWDGPVDYDYREGDKLVLAAVDQL